MAWKTLPRSAVFSMWGYRGYGAGRSATGTAARSRMAKVTTMPGGGTSFTEDYQKSNELVLASHMLESASSIVVNINRLSVLVCDDPPSSRPNRPVSPLLDDGSGDTVAARKTVFTTQRKHRISCRNAGGERCGKARRICQLPADLKACAVFSHAEPGRYAASSRCTTLKSQRLLAIIRFASV